VIGAREFALARASFLDSYIRCGVSARSVAQARCLRYLGLAMYPFLLLPIKPDANQSLGGGLLVEQPYLLYALSLSGEAAERALAVFEKTLHQPGELQTAALRDITEFLEAIRIQLESAEPDVAKLHTQLLTLTERFRTLTNRAQAFMRDLQSTIQLHGVSVEQFLEYKQLLIDYLERFLGDLVLATNDISQKILLLERAGIREQFRLVARRSTLNRKTKDLLVKTGVDRSVSALVFGLVDPLTPGKNSTLPRRGGSSTHA